VGCGTAFHEIKLLEANVVGHFDLYEISEDRIKKIKDAATKAGVLDRIDIFNVNPLELNHKKKYDLVYWKDALHHMLNAKYGVEWSFEMLNQSGLFFMNDFVGPSYMQYSEKSLDIAEKVRKSLPVRCLTDPRDPSKTLPYRRVRPDIETIKSIDPTECADSSNIIPALKIVFDKVNIIPTGGVVYSLALSDVLANLHEEHDSELLSTLMMCDDVCTSLGEYLYAVAYAIKD
jgi:SAM-dependent methyltransferase